MKDNALKYLICIMPNAEYLSRGQTQLVTQSYMMTRENFELKTLKTVVGESISYLLVSKATSGKNRQRKDIEISVAQYEFFQDIPLLRSITKNRTTIIDGDFILKFDDFFEGTVLGKIFMLELDVLPNSLKLPTEYVFPDLAWVKGRKDVSGDAQYFNQNLAILKSK